MEFRDLACSLRIEYVYIRNVDYPGFQGRAMPKMWEDLDKTHRL